MLKGINRRIIEVNDRDNKYFEKAVLFLRTDCNLSTSELDDEARKYITQAQQLYESDSRHHSVSSVLLGLETAATVILSLSLSVYLIMLIGEL